MSTIPIVYGWSDTAKPMAKSTQLAKADAAFTKAVAKTASATKGKLRSVTKTSDVLGHIFRTITGHVNLSTIASQNRYINLFENVANNGISNTNILNPYQRNTAGFEGFSQIFRSRKQVWTQTLNKKVIDAGVNIIPK